MEEFKKNKPNRKMSQAVGPECVVGGDTLDLNFKGITLLDSVPGFYQRVTKLNLAYNGLSSLRGMDQFRRLTHLNIDHNSITHLEEMSRIEAPLQVLSFEGNPCRSHPDVLSSCLSMFPRLTELNGSKVTYGMKEDVADALKLTSKLFPYFCRSEDLIRKQEGALQKLKIKLELFTYMKQKGQIDAHTGPYWEEVNGLHSKILRGLKSYPAIPYSDLDSLRPRTILNFVQTMERSLDDCSPESSDKKQIFEWLFCEVLILENSWNSPQLQLFLRGRLEGSPSLQEAFLRELDEFVKLLPETEDRARQRADIFPSKPNKAVLKTSTIDSAAERGLFPIFAGNRQYLKALMSILENQLGLLLDMTEEYRELLRFDTEGLLPSFSDSRARLDPPLSVSPQLFVRRPYELSPTEESRVSMDNILNTYTGEVRASDDRTVHMRSLSIDITERMIPPESYEGQFTFKAHKKKDRIKTHMYAHLRKTHEARLARKTVRAWRRFIASKKALTRIVNKQLMRKLFVRWAQDDSASEKSIQTCRNGFDSIFTLHVEDINAKRAKVHCAKKMLAKAFGGLRRSVLETQHNDSSQFTFCKAPRVDLKKQTTEKQAFKDSSNLGKPRKVVETIKRDAAKLAGKILTSRRCMEKLWRHVKVRGKSGSGKCSECTLEQNKKIARELSSLQLMLKKHRQSKKAARNKSSAR